MGTKNSNQKGKAKGKAKKVGIQRGRGLRPLRRAGAWVWGTREWNLMGWGHRAGVRILALSLIT